jgi:hypothetical protein
MALMMPWLVTLMVMETRLELTVCKLQQFQVCRFREVMLD